MTQEPEPRSKPLFPPTSDKSSLSGELPRALHHPTLPTNLQGRPHRAPRLQLRELRPREAPGVHWNTGLCDTQDPCCDPNTRTTAPARPEPPHLLSLDCGRRLPTALSISLLLARHPLCFSRTPG